MPPTKYCGGWVTFVVSLMYIGILTAFVADIASIFGCLIDLEDCVTAITFVALGTSLPDTFASQMAAINDDDADASIVNVTGSNSVNVFLGLGFPWVLCCLTHMASDFEYEDGSTGVYKMNAGSLGFSVAVFCPCATVCLGVLVLRRSCAGGELGGPKAMRYCTSALFITLWVVSPSARCAEV